MIDRVCISITNRCNQNCAYCHFHQKGYSDNEPMDVYEILDNIKEYNRSCFKIGFVGNGESFLELEKLKEYITYIEDCPGISCYTITNGTVSVLDSDWRFFEEHNVNVGFSLDGFKELHNLYRGDTYDMVSANVERYRKATGHYPTFNATVGHETIKNAERVISFFWSYNTKVTFSRMIGEDGITLDEYHRFLDQAEKSIRVRRGGNDCTMYGGKCGAGINNFFFSNGKVYYCGNCVDLPSIADSSISFEQLEQSVDKLNFDRNRCYKDIITEDGYN